MSTQVDETTVRQFIEIISAHARRVINGAGPKGVLQLCRINPIDESVVPSRFTLDDVENMVRTAVGDALAGHNSYIEARTLRDGLRGRQRGTFEDTAWVFGLVADCDADKNKGGNITVRPSLVIETSPGNFHFWYLFTRAIPAAQAKLIGDAIRASSGTDQDTGVITQCYRVAGTPNFPSATKQARGRVAIEATRIVEQTGRLWDPDELLAAFSRVASAAAAAAAPIDYEATLPEELLKDIREGGVGKGNDKSRSALFQSVIDQLKRRHWSIENIIALFEKYPNGVAKKYVKRLRKEVERSYNKAVSGVVLVATAPSPGSAAAAPQGSAASASASASASAAASTAASAPTAAAIRVLPTIRLVDGQLPYVVSATEHAMISAGLEIYTRGGTLVYPTFETRLAANGRKTMAARLSAFTADSFIEPVAEAAIFQRWNVRKKAWVDVDPPNLLVRMALARARRWAYPHVSGIITTPALRPDGSLLATPGYDSPSELYLLPSLQLPPIAERPTRQDALAALAKLKDLFCEFSFQDKKRDGLEKRLNCSVAISALLTALLRGSMPTAPIYLVRADTPGTGKSHLVDVIAMVATGQFCPVITAAKSVEETEKRLGAVLLGAIPIFSLDNCTYDLEGELLCQLTERPVVNVRILGRSEMPPCECRATVFATGNNITFRGDMVRRGLVCDLEAHDERPELRVFQKDALEVAANNRGAYVAAALTIVRAYLAADAPSVCGPFGSYAGWSRMVRSPLIWLNEPDPIISMEGIRGEDAVLNSIREFASLWLDYGLDLNTPHLTINVIEAACMAPPNYWGPMSFKQFLLRVAASKGDPGAISADRLGLWLRKISGRIVRVTDAQGTPRKYRLVKVQDDRIGRARFELEEVN
jgi:RepB DNA-primase from phage plasmid